MLKTFRLNTHNNHYLLKELWYNNVGMSSIQHKADAIVNSFISSNFPPSIQISIEPELADKIQSKSKKPTATLFKEAQVYIVYVADDDDDDNNGYGNHPIQVLIMNFIDVNYYLNLCGFQRNSFWHHSQSTLVNLKS